MFSKMALFFILHHFHHLRPWLCSVLRMLELELVHTMGHVMALNTMALNTMVNMTHMELVRHVGDSQLQYLMGILQLELVMNRNSFATVQNSLVMNIFVFFDHIRHMVPLLQLQIRYRFLYIFCWSMTALLNSCCWHHKKQEHCIHRYLNHMIEKNILCKVHYTGLGHYILSAKSSYPNNLEHRIHHHCWNHGMIHRMKQILNLIK